MPDIPPNEAEKRINSPPPEGWREATGWVLTKKMNDKKTGIIFGTFDIVHPGHLHLFKQARKHCNYLVTVIARDKTVWQVKGRYPKNKEIERLKNVRNNKIADKAVLGSLRDKYAVIKKYRPDIIFLGYDQNAFTENLKLKLSEFKLNKTKIIRLKPYHPEIYKTSKINGRTKKGQT